MKFFKRMKIKRNARYVISSAITHQPSGDNQPGELFNNPKVIGAIAEGLSDLESNQDLDKKDRDIIVEGVREELKCLFVPRTDLVCIVEFSKNFLNVELERETMPESTPPVALSPMEYVVTHTNNFIFMATLIIDHEKLNKDMPKAGSCMFFLGSASCLSKKCDIEEEELGRAVLEIMKGYGLSHENAMHFIASYDELLSEPLGKEAFQEGFHAMKDFLEGNDVNSPLRLRHLVERWADL